jgi:hypothetical protein
MLVYQLIHAHNLVSSFGYMFGIVTKLLDKFIVKIQRLDHADDAFF